MPPDDQPRGFRPKSEREKPPATNLGFSPGDAAARLASVDQIPTAGYPPAPPAETPPQSAMERLQSIGGAVTDRGFQSDVARGLVDVANRTAAGVLGGPVDIAATALGALGYQHPAPVGGSEWIGQQMEHAGAVTPERRTAAEMLGSLAGPGAAAKAVTGLGFMAAMSPEGKARLLADLTAGKGSGTYRLGDVTQGQANALQRFGMPASAGRDVTMTDAAHQHLMDARLSRDNFSPAEVVQFAKQAMEPRSNVVRDPASAGHKAALANDGLLDPVTKKRYTAQMPLKEGGGGMEVVSVIPRGLPARKTKAPE